MSINFHDILENRLERELTCEQARSVWMMALSMQGAGMLLVPNAVTTVSGKELEDQLIDAMTRPLIDRECNCYVSRTVM